MFCIRAGTPVTGIREAIRVPSWEPDAYDRKCYSEAQVIEAKFSGLVILYGWHSRAFWAFGAACREPLRAESASELLVMIQNAERSRPFPRFEPGPPTRPYA